MANRNFDSRAVIERLQNRIYSRNLYQNNTSGQRIINNPQTTDGNSSRFVPYQEGAQTEYFRSLSGTTMVSPGGIENIPPYPAPSSTISDAPTSLVATPGNAQLSIAFTQGSNGGSPITNYLYSTDNGVTFTACNPAVTSSPVVITGLTNGTTYLIKLKAVNANGPSAASASVSGTPITVPAAPTSLVATPGNAQVSVAFTQGSNGGSAITNYEYSTDNGVTFTACSPTVTASPVVITGLTNGITYQIKLKAVNAAGASAASSAVSSTPATVPDAPVIVSASDGNTTATINFTQGSNGGSPIVNYYYSTDNGVSFAALLPESTVSPITITGLTNGTTYQIRLKAINLVGLSDVSNDISVTPFGTPVAPTNLIATPGDTQVSISFSQGSDGGSPITNYYYSTDNGASFYTFSPAVTTSPVLITGLTNGTTYQIKLEAVNLAGASPASAAVSATPATSPDAPTNLVATPGNAQVSVAFTQGSTGGSPITNYQYSTDNGTTFFAFSPADIVSPVTISKLSTDGTTSLTNGVTYNIQLKAVNAAGVSFASSTVSATPVAPTIVSFSTVGPSSWTAPAGITSINYLVVGGGGGSGGGYDTGGGGGGGGGMVITGTLSVTPGTSYPIVVGGGGTAGISNRLALPETNGGDGSDSSFDTIVALGGGGGYASRAGPPDSGGGSRAVNTGTASTGGHGGGSAGDFNGAGGGGGGSAGNGADGASNAGGSGGVGTSSSIFGFALNYGTGGRGANGNSNIANAGVAGTPNTGNGARGGGAASSSDNDGAAGGSGIVVISYTP